MLGGASPKGHGKGEGALVGGNGDEVGDDDAAVPGEELEALVQAFGGHRAEVEAAGGGDRRYEVSQGCPAEVKVAKPEMLGDTFSDFVLRGAHSFPSARVLWPENWQPQFKNTSALTNPDMFLGQIPDVVSQLQFFDAC